MSTRMPAFPGSGRRARSSPRCDCGIPPEKGSAACRFRVGSREGEAVLSFPFESGWREPAATPGCASAISPIRLSATDNSSPFACRTEGIRALFVAWRDGRAAEGARLESVYTVHPVSWVRIPLPPPGCVSHAAGKSKSCQAYSYPENWVVVAAGPLKPRRFAADRQLGPPSSWAGSRAAARRGRAQVRKCVRTRQGTSAKLSVRAAAAMRVPTVRLTSASKRQPSTDGYR